MFSFSQLSQEKQNLEINQVASGWGGEGYLDRAKTNKEKRKMETAK